jgi:hypothetical protein
MPIWEFSDYDYESLKEVIKAAEIFEERGIGVDDEMYAEMQAEFEKFENYTITYRDEFTVTITARSEDEARELLANAKWENITGMFHNDFIQITQEDE